MKAFLYFLLILQVILIIIGIYFIFETLLSVPYWIDRMINDRIQSWYMSCGWGLFFLVLLFGVGALIGGILIMLRQVWDWIYDCF